LTEYGSASQLGDMVSLVFIFLTMAALIVASSRTRTLRSFQAEMLIFAVVLFAAEIPEILSTLGLVNLAPIQDIGEELHALSMVILSGFVVYRVYGFFRAK